MENTLKKTALNAMHYEMGAKMVPFAGFDMPVQFMLKTAAELCFP